MLHDNSYDVTSYNILNDKVIETVIIVISSKSRIIQYSNINVVRCLADTLVYLIL